MSTPFHGNIEQLTQKNDNFRQVIFTAPYCQLVLMTIKVGEEIGIETHSANDQFFRFEAGEGKAIVAGKEYSITNGTALLVPAGTEHNIINTGSVPLKLYTLYSPAHHIGGRVHTTKEDAMKDVEDEEFGNKYSVK